MLLTFYVVMVLVGVILGVILVKVSNTNKKFKSEYDERQEVIRGRGYKYAMITGWALMLLLFVMDLGEINLPVKNGVLYFSAIIITCMVHVCYCTWNEAYLALNNDPKKYAILFFVLTVINLGLTVIAGISRGLVVDGVLMEGVINAECALIFIVLGVIVWIKSIVKKEEREEDEDEES